MEKETHMFFETTKGVIYEVINYFPDWSLEKLQTEWKKGSGNVKWGIIYSETKEKRTDLPRKEIRKIWREEW